MDVPPSPAPRPGPRLSLVVWGAIAAGLAVFLGVAAWLEALRPPAEDAAAARSPLAWVALLVAAAGLVASRVVSLRSAGLDPDAPPGRTRLVVALALAEPGGLLGGVAWIATGNPLAAVAAGLGLAGVLLAFPRRPAGPGAAGAPPNRLVR